MSITPNSYNKAHPQVQSGESLSDSLQSMASDLLLLNEP